MELVNIFKKMEDYYNVQNIYNSICNVLQLMKKLRQYKKY